MICPISNSECAYGCWISCTSDDTRLVIESVDMVSRGPTFAERVAAHERGECDAMCGICYHEACEHSSKGGENG